LLLPGAVENAKVLLEDRVPCINFSLGKGDWLVKAAHEYGGKVFATVVNDTHARKAQDIGVDGIIVTGHEAAAHGGDVASLVLIANIASQLRVPVIAAGGVANGAGLAAALALGAEGVAIGTRFMSTQESPLHQTYKRLSVKKSVYDTIYSDRFDGLASRVMDTEAARKAQRWGLNIFKAFNASRKAMGGLNLSFAKMLFRVLAAGVKDSLSLAHLAVGSEAYRLATEEGDTVKGILPVGQSMGLVQDIPSVADLVERIVAEAQGVQERMAAQFSQN
jgi:enoyl-[acyl-carrier protein] reductase II